MIDPYYRVKQDIHKKRPAYGVLCFVWMVFMAFIAGFFGYYSYNIETRQPCFVREEEYAPFYQMPIGTSNYDEVDDVAY